MNWSAANPLSSTAFFWTVPGMTYTVSYLGDEENYPQYIDGVDAMVADVDSATTFTVSSNADPEQVAYNLKAGSSARGRAVFADGKVPIDAKVTAYRVQHYDDEEWTDTFPEITASVDADGSYLLRPLLPGAEYQICVTAPTYVEACLGDSPVDPDNGGWDDPDLDSGQDDKAIFTAPAAHQKIVIGDITLSNRSGAIEGRLYGFSRSGWNVYAISLAGDLSYYAEEAGNGFRITDLPSGPYLLVGQGFGQDGNPDRGSETLVNVAEGEIAEQDVTVGPTGKQQNLPGPRANWDGDLGHTQVSISQSFTAGETLTATADTTDNDVDPNYSYYWTDGTTIVGQEQSLEITSELAGKNISAFVLVTGEKAWPRWAIASISDMQWEQLNPIIAPFFIEGAEPQIGSKTTVDVGEWDPAPEIVDYQWLLDGETIPGANGPSYTPIPGEEDCALSLQLTLRRANHEPTVWEVYADDIIVLGEGAAFQAKISGTAAVGKKLTAVPGPPDSETSYQWLRSGKSIKGATSRTYKVAKADAGKKIAVEMTVTRPGYSEKVLVSNVKKIPKFKSSIKAYRLASTSSANFRVYVTVKTGADVGKVRVTVNSYSKTYTLKKGKITAKLPKLKPGKHQVKFSYLGTANNKAISKKVTFSVR
jgi:hypothetical protein